MAGIDRDMICQHKELFPDIVQQLLMVAARKIGTANAAVKQYISANQETILPGIETKMCRRMARGKDQLQLTVPKSYRTGLFQENFRFW